MIKYISSDSKYKFKRATCSWNQKWKNDASQCECKKYLMWKKDYGWNPVTYIPENSEYLKRIIDDLVIKCDEIINVTDSVSVNDKKVRYKMDCYIFPTFLLGTI